MKNYINAKQTSGNFQEEETDSMIRFSRAIIAQAFIDLCRKYSRTEDVLAQKDAKEWLSKSSRDLRYICNMAKISEGQVIKKAEKMINLQHSL